MLEVSVVRPLEDNTGRQWGVLFGDVSFPDYSDTVFLSYQYLSLLCLEMSCCIHSLAL